MVREKNQSWILRATIDSDIIENIVRAAWIGKRGDAFIINRTNILQTSPRFGGAILEQPRAPDFSKVTAPEAEEIPYDGEEMLYATGIIKLKKWILVIREDPTEQLGPLLRARFIMVLIFLGGVLLIGIGAVLITRSMMNELVLMDRKKAASDELAVQENKMAALGKMAAGIAHEINNPLAVIGEKAGWIKDLLKMEDSAKTENNQEYLDSVNKIEQHINRAKTITHRLLGFARRMEPSRRELISIRFWMRAWPFWKTRPATAISISKRIMPRICRDHQRFLAIATGFSQYPQQCHRRGGQRRGNQY